MKIRFLLLGAIVALGGAVALVMFYGMGDIRRLVIHEVDLQKVRDGTYDGSYHKGRWRYDLQVTMRDHRIIAVRSFGPRLNRDKDFNTKVEAAIIKRQAIGVDVVSGATIHSRAFQKAVENALAAAVR